MSLEKMERGRAELRRARRASRGLYWATALFSVVVNLLMLTGPLFMLQVYDRVLGSGSEATLVALFAIVAFLYAMMGLLDSVRSRVLARIGARFQDGLDERVFSAAMRRGATGATPGDPTEDLGAVRTMLASRMMAALYDLPFTPLFLAGIALFHPYLGLLALAGGALLVLVTLLHRAAARVPETAAQQAARDAVRFGGQMQDEAEAIRALGMQDAAFKRWLGSRRAALGAAIRAADATSGYAAVSRALRLFLQSAMLALGAWLVLQRDLTPGAMIASSILLGRALQPIEMLVGQWALIQNALRGWNRLAELLGEVPAEPPRTALPRPAARLRVDQLTVIPPGQAQAALRLVSFTVEPGEALGIIGPSGAGKTTLARALTGSWRPAGGTIRLDGATLDQYAPEALGRHIGYLPQRVQLFDGTIAENIAKLADAPDSAAVVAAARKAAAHEMILQLPEGYDTRVSSVGARLSGGQLQRIGLARALFGEPVLVILDEPNSNLDNTGNHALNAAIRNLKAEGSAVLIMAHRPAAIQECDKLLVLEGGGRRAFGPRDEVLRDVVRNSGEILRNPGPGGVR